MAGTNFYTKTISASGNVEYVALTDENGLAALVRGTVVPTSGSYSKGCLFIKSDATTGVKAVYENNGTTTSPSFSAISGNYETKTVTVLAAATQGTTTVTTGDTIIGYYPTSNQDQFVDSVSITGTTLKVILGAAATANNVFAVTLLKA